MVESDQVPWVPVRRVLVNASQPFPAVRPSRFPSSATKVDDRVRNPRNNGSLLFGQRAVADGAVVFAVCPDHLVASIRVWKGGELAVGEDMICGVAGSVL